MFLKIKFFFSDNQHHFNFWNIIDTFLGYSESLSLYVFSHQKVNIV